MLRRNEEIRPLILQSFVAGAPSDLGKLEQLLEHCFSFEEDPRVSTIERFECSATLVEALIKVYFIQRWGESLQIHRVKVIGDLNLSHTQFDSSFKFKDCIVFGSLDLNGCSGQRIKIVKTRVHDCFSAIQLHLSGSLTLRRGHYLGGIILRGARIGHSLKLQHLKVDAIRSTRIRNGFWTVPVLDQDMIPQPPVAVLADELQCDGGVIVCSDENAFLDNKWTGGLFLRHARIGQSLVIRTIKICPDFDRINRMNTDNLVESGFAGIAAHHIYVGAGLILGNSLIVKGHILFQHAEIRGVLHIRGLTTAAPVLGLDSKFIVKTARVGHECRIGGPYGEAEDRRKQKNFVSLAGPLDLDAMNIEGNLWIDGLRIESRHSSLDAADKPYPTAISACNTTITGMLEIYDLEAFGSCWIVGSNIGGDLMIRSSTFKSPNIDRKNANSYAISFRATNVAGAFVLGLPRSDLVNQPNGGSVIFDGITRFRDMTVAGEVLFQGVVFRYSGRDLWAMRDAGARDAAFDMSNAKVFGSFTINFLCQFEGPVQMDGIEVNGDLRIFGTAFGSGLATGEVLDLSHSKVDGRFSWNTKNEVEKFDGLQRSIRVNLSDMNISRLDGTLRGLQLMGARFRMAGTRFGSIAILEQEGTSRDVSKEFWWISDNLRDDTSLQPYEELCKHLRFHERDKDAEDIAYKKQIKSDELRNTLSKNDSPRRLLDEHIFYFWRILLRLSVGYGYRPMNSVKIVLFYLFIGTASANCAFESEMLTNVLAQNYLACEKKSDVRCEDAMVFGGGSWRIAFDREQTTYPAFNSIVYGLDLILPIIDLGQEKFYVLKDNSTKPEKVGAYWFWIFGSIFTFIKISSWFLILLLFASPTRLLRRD